jgi:hypothetical protein
MKKIVVCLLSIIICIISCSCNENRQDVTPEKIEITKDNIREYVTIELVFESIDSYKTSDEEDSSNEYTNVCVAKVNVKPKADYAFENASLTYRVSGPTTWKIHQNEKYPHLSNKITAGGNKNITDMSIDKEGYGESSIFLRNQSSSITNPHNVSSPWNIEIVGAVGYVYK